MDVRNENIGKTLAGAQKRWVHGGKLWQVSLKGVRLFFWSFDSSDGPDGDPFC